MYVGTPLLHTIDRRVCHAKVLAEAGFVHFREEYLGG